MSIHLNLAHWQFCLSHTTNKLVPLSFTSVLAIHSSLKSLTYLLQNLQQPAHTATQPSQLSTSFHSCGVTWFLGGAVPTLPLKLARRLKMQFNVLVNLVQGGASWLHNPASFSNAFYAPTYVIPLIFPNNSFLMFSFFLKSLPSSSSLPILSQKSSHTVFTEFLVSNAVHGTGW